jgi:hypothetical protein
MFLDLVGYLIPPTTDVSKNTSVHIGDILDREAVIFVDNCTQLVCQPTGIKKKQVPCQGR